MLSNLSTKSGHARCPKCHSKATTIMATDSGTDHLEGASFVLAVWRCLCGNQFTSSVTWTL